MFSKTRGTALGNINQTHLIELIASNQQLKFGRDKFDTLPQYCPDCDVRITCHGGCPKDCFINTPDGQPGLNCRGVENDQANCREKSVNGKVLEAVVWNYVLSLLLDPERFESVWRKA